MLREGRRPSDSVRPGPRRSELRRHDDPPGSSEVSRDGRVRTEDGPAASPRGSAAGPSAWLRIAALIVAVSVLLNASVVFTAAAAAPAAQPSSVSASEPVSGGSTVFAATTPDGAAENDTSATRHRNPNEAHEDGNGDDLRAYLAEQLSTRLQDSVVAVDRGEYDRARGLVGDDYDDLLRKYVDVSGDPSGDEPSAQSFERTKETQRQFVESVADYQETSDEYREAQQEGNETRARELARELERLSDATNENQADLAQNYSQLSDATGASYAEETQVSEAISRNISAQQADIRQAVFVQTETTILDHDPGGSFSDPIGLSGRLTEANGTAIGDRTVTIAVGEQTYSVVTDQNGQFSLDYRPTTLPIGRQTVAVQYVPANDSVYFGSNTTMSVDVAQVEPTVSIDESPARTKYGDPVVVDGDVAVDGDGPAAVPVSLSIGGEVIAWTRTDGSGAFHFETVLPANVSAGDRQLRAGLPLSNRTLAPAADARPVTVDSTPTSVLVSATQTGRETARLSGRFTTEGAPVAGQSIHLSIGGTPVGTVTTADNGTYLATVTIPAEHLDGAQVEVVAAHRGVGTNLEAATGRTTLTLRADSDGAPWADSGDGSASGGWVDGGSVGLGDGGDDEDDAGGLETLARGILAILGPSQPAERVLPGVETPFGWIPGWILFSGAGILLVGGAVVLRQTGRSPADSASESIDDAGGVDDAPADTNAEPISPASSLARARESLSRGDTEAAVEWAYAAVRRHFVDELDIPSRGTPREFYAACRSASLDRDELVGRVTELYERAVFTTSRPSDADAEEVLDVASNLLSGRS